MVYRTVDEQKCLFVLQAEQHLLLNEAFSWRTSCCWRSFPLANHQELWWCYSGHLCLTGVVQETLLRGLILRLQKATLLTLHTPSSEIVVLRRIRTWEYGVFGSVAKTMELFMRFGGWLAYKKESLTMGEIPWNKHLSLTHMVFKPVKLRLALGRGDSCFTLNIVYLVASILQQNSLLLYGGQTSFRCTQPFPKTVFFTWNPALMYKIVVPQF